MSVQNLALQTASSTGQPIGVDERQKVFSIFFTFTLLGVYAAGGDTLDLTQLFALTAGGPGSSNPSGSLPIKLEMQSVKTPGGANLFLYSFAPGTTLANGKVQVFTGAAAQTGLTELGAGAYPAGVLADTIEVEAIFPKM